MKFTPQEIAKFLNDEAGDNITEKEALDATRRIVEVGLFKDNGDGTFSLV